MAEGHTEIPTWAPPAPVVATPQQIDLVAQILASTANPIIITEHGGRTDAERAALVGIAEALVRRFSSSGIPPTTISRGRTRCTGRGRLKAVLGEADAILLASCNGPWHPPHTTSRPGCTVIHVEQDPMRPRAAYWGYPTTHTIPGALPVNLVRSLTTSQKRSTPRPEAAERWARYTRGVRAAAIEQAGQLSSQATDFVPAAELFGELHDALPDDAICVDEVTAQVPQMIQLLYERKPFSQYRGWAGARGTGLGTALGVKLARPQQVVLCMVGDGAWHYNPVPAALGFAQEYGVPLLIVSCNNRQYASQTRNLLKYYPEGAAVRDGNSVGNVIQPTPDYVKQAEAYGGAGERVQKFSELRPALQRALEVVGSGRTFMLDVIVNPYGTPVHQGGARPRQSASACPLRARRSRRSGPPRSSVRPCDASWPYLLR